MVLVTTIANLKVNNPCSSIMKFNLAIYSMINGNQTSSMCSIEEATSFLWPKLGILSFPVSKFDM